MFSILNYDDALINKIIVMYYTYYFNIEDIAFKLKLKSDDVEDILKDYLIEVNINDYHIFNEPLL